MNPNSSVGIVLSGGDGYICLISVFLYSVDIGMKHVAWTKYQLSCTQWLLKSEPGDDYDGYTGLLWQDNWAFYDGAYTVIIASVASDNCSLREAFQTKNGKINLGLF